MEVDKATVEREATQVIVDLENFSVEVQRLVVGACSTVQLSGVNSRSRLSRTALSFSRCSLGIVQGNALLEPARRRR